MVEGLGTSLLVVDSVDDTTFARDFGTASDEIEWTGRNDSDVEYLHESPRSWHLEQRGRTISQRAFAVVQGTHAFFLGGARRLEDRLGIFISNLENISEIYPSVKRDGIR